MFKILVVKKKFFGGLIKVFFCRAATLNAKKTKIRKSTKNSKTKKISLDVLIKSFVWGSFDPTVRLVTEIPNKKYCR